MFLLQFCWVLNLIAVATGILWYTYASVKWNLDSTDPTEHLDKSVHNATAILVYAILATIFTVSQSHHK